jgi:[methyl-Co(III) methanol-specific corrinoid protein]:coenzyme M methyltransferase
LGQAQVQAGADVVTLADPTATGEILGPRRFEEFAMPYLRQLTEEIQAAGAKVIVHICGDVHTIVESLRQIGADALSVDAMVNLRGLRRAVAPLAVMGNLSAFVLESGPPKRIERWVRMTGSREASIIAPACAVTPATPLVHLQALSQAVKRLP